MHAPRVLVVLDTVAAWSRGVLRGFMSAAHERGWTLLHYSPLVDLNWVADEWAPDVAVIGPGLDAASLGRLAPASLVSVTVDRSAARIASVCLDEERIGALALQHLLSTGLRCVSTCRYSQSPFAVARERAFLEKARAAGLEIAVGWGSDEAWQEVGKSAALLVQRALCGEAIGGERMVISPLAVIPRRSSEILAIDDALVAQAVRWIRANIEQRLSVTMVSRAVASSRQRLERRFRRVLDRTLKDEIRRARVEAARELLTKTRSGLSEVAKLSGFTTAALLNVAFRRELGMPPGVYRRRVRQELCDVSED